MTTSFDTPSKSQNRLAKSSRCNPDEIKARRSLSLLYGTAVNPHAEIVETRGLILPNAFNLCRDDVAFVSEKLRALV